MPEPTPVRAPPGRPTDEASWRRLSPWSVLFLFARTVLRVMRENIPALAGAGAGVALIDQLGMREVLLAATAVLLLVGTGSLWYYRRFRFRVDGDVLRVQKGLLERSDLKVHADRVQHLAIEQPLQLRMFGLVRLKVDTVGGPASEVELPGISQQDAERLRRILDRGGGDGAPAPGRPSATHGETVYRIGAAGLTLHGVASNYVYVAAAAAAPFLQMIEQRLRDALGEAALARWLAVVGGQPWLAGTLLLLGVFALLMALSVIVVWLRFHGFTLIRDTDRFVQRSGLFNRQEQILSTGKLQSVERVQTAVGRLLGRSHLVCRQIGGARPGDERAGGTFVVPGLDRSGATRLAAMFWPGLDPEPAFRPVHRYYRRVRLLRLSLAVAAMLLVISLAAGTAAWLTMLPVAPLLMWPLAHLRWRAVGWHATAEHIQVRHGLLGRQTTLFARTRVQRVSVQQSWFQRRHAVVTVTLTLASGPVTIPFIDERDANRLVNDTLYRVESAAASAAAEARRRTG